MCLCVQSIYIIHTIHIVVGRIIEDKKVKFYHITQNIQLIHGRLF